MNLHDVIISPMMTEKTEALKNPSENINRYTIKVRTDANKELIRQALHKIYRVDAVKINIINVRGKNKRFRQDHFRSPSWKKAIVTLSKGQKVDFSKSA